MAKDNNNTVIIAAVAIGGICILMLLGGVLLWWNNTSPTTSTSSDGSGGGGGGSDSSTNQGSGTGDSGTSSTDTGNSSQGQDQSQSQSQNAAPAAAAVPATGMEFRIGGLTYSKQKTKFFDCPFKVGNNTYYGRTSNSNTCCDKSFQKCPYPKSSGRVLPTNSNNNPFASNTTSTSADNPFASGASNCDACVKSMTTSLKKMQKSGAGSWSSSKTAACKDCPSRDITVSQGGITMQKSGCPSKTLTWTSAMRGAGGLTALGAYLGPGNTGCLVGQDLKSLSS